MLTFDIGQAKKRLPELIEQTMSGDEVVITQAGKPIVKLVAINKPIRKQRLFGSAKGFIKMAADFDEPLEDYKAYM